MIAVNLLTCNELPYVRNLVRQLPLIADEIYICDDYSKDGTWEYLNDVKKQYNLNLYQRTCDWKPGAQRDFLLSKSPNDCWIFSIDADEIPTFGLRWMIKDLLNNCSNPPEIDRVCIYTFNLINDLEHYHMDIGVQGRFYWNDDRTKPYHLDVPHDTLMGNWSTPECGVVKYEQGIVHLKLLDKDKVKSGRTTWIEKGIYEKDHIGEVFESKKFDKLPAHIGFDITSELIEHLKLGEMCEK